MKSYETNMATISQLDSGIIRVELKQGATVTLEDLIENSKIYSKFIKEGEKGLFLVIFANQLMGQIKLDDKSAVSNRSDFKLAEAIIVSHAAHLLESNFYKNYFSPTHPIKVFEQEDFAKEWLLSFLED